MVRGTDVNGSAANFVETEQIVELDDGMPESRRWTSFLQVCSLKTNTFSLLFSSVVRSLCCGHRSPIFDGNPSLICVPKTINWMPI